MKVTISIVDNQRSFALYGGKMKSLLSVTGIAAVSIMFALSACSTQEEVAPKPAPKPAAPAPAPAPEAKAPAEKAAEKAKATKVAGDVGLLDTEKNYMIVVTKEGKLVTIDFDAKFQPTQREPVNAKIADIGLGSSAVVQYTKQGDKNVASSVEFVPAKGE
jgi:hypothetical protein